MTTDGDDDNDDGNDNDNDGDKFLRKTTRWGVQ